MLLYNVKKCTNIFYFRIEFLYSGLKMVMIGKTWEIGCRVKGKTKKRN